MKVREIMGGSPGDPVTAALQRPFWAPDPSHPACPIMADQTSVATIEGPTGPVMVITLLRDGRIIGYADFAPREVTPFVGAVLQAARKMGDA